MQDWKDTFHHPEPVEDSINSDLCEKKLEVTNCPQDGGKEGCLPQKSRTLWVRLPAYSEPPAIVHRMIL
jgi:hypothetical protein